MESYVLGSTRGYKSKNEIEVVIETRTTTPEATKPTTTTMESLPTTQSSTITEPTTSPSTTSTTEEIEILPDYSDSEEDESQHKSDDTDTEGIVPDDPEEVVTALPVSDLEAAPSQTSAGLIAGVIVCLAAMGLVSAGVGVTYYRRRKSHRAIISYLQAVSVDKNRCVYFGQALSMYVVGLHFLRHSLVQQMGSLSFLTKHS